MDPDNLQPSPDKFELTEWRIYKLDKIKRSFLEALKFERKEFIAERPKKRQPPLVYITEYNLQLQNLRKTLNKGWDLEQLFPSTPPPPPPIAF